jgi:hypothetical protein
MGLVARPNGGHIVTLQRAELVRIIASRRASGDGRLTVVVLVFVWDDLLPWRAPGFGRGFGCVERRSYGPKARAVLDISNPWPEVA